MTPAELKEIRDRLNAATPGPWDMVWRQGHRVVARREGEDELFHDLIARVSGIPANAELIANAPDDLRRLIERVKELEAENKELYTHIEEDALIIGKSGTRELQLITRVKALEKLLLQCLERLDDGDNSDRLYCEITCALGGER